MKGCSILFKGRIVFVSILSLMLLIFFLSFPSDVKSSVKSGLIMCSEIIIPSLFPFAAVSVFINNTKVSLYIKKLLFPISKYVLKTDPQIALTYYLSLLGGYPVGAKLIGEMKIKDIISDKDANTLLMFCFNAAPSFVIIAVGNGILHSSLLGWIMLFCETFSSLILFVGISHRLKPSVKENFGKYESIGEGFTKSIITAGNSMFTISFFVVFFSVVLSVIKKIVGSEYIYFVAPIIEITAGVISLSDNNLYLTVFFLAFGGLSLHFQVFATCGIRIDYIKFYIGRIFHGILSVFIFWLTIKIIPIPCETVSFGKNIGKYLMFSGTSVFSFALVLMTIVMMVYTFLFVNEKRAPNGALEFD